MVTNKLLGMLSCPTLSALSQSRIECHDNGVQHIGLSNSVCTVRFVSWSAIYFSALQHSRQVVIQFVRQLLRKLVFKYMIGLHYTYVRVHMVIVCLVSLTANQDGRICFTACDILYGVQAGPQCCHTPDILCYNDIKYCRSIIVNEYEK